MPRLKLDPLAPMGVSPADEPVKPVIRSQGHGYVTNNITRLLRAGSNVTLSGTGTESSPYVVASSGGGSSVTNLDDLADVTLAGAGDGDSLVFNGSTWENGTPVVTPVWGSIAGNITDQSDLQAAFDTKASTLLAIAYAVAL
jgi:hypothetical protein